MAYYVDTSALVKLVVAEAESSALRAWLSERPRGLVACDLVRTELMRAVRRVAADRVIDARTVLDSVTLTKVTTAIFSSAGLLDPIPLRSLDALHVAAALDLGDDLVGLVAYDERLIEAAAANGIRAFTPR